MEQRTSGWTFLLAGLIMCCVAGKWFVDQMTDSWFKLKPQNVPAPVRPRENRPSHPSTLESPETHGYDQRVRISGMPTSDGVQGTAAHTPPAEPASLEISFTFGEGSTVPSSPVSGALTTR